MVMGMVNAVIPHSWIGDTYDLAQKF
jgi:hypothetical protein